MEQLTTDDLGIVYDALLNEGHSDLARRVRAIRGEMLREQEDHEQAADVQTRIHTAYREHAQAPGEFLPLRRIRAKLADLPRTAVDAELDRMYRAQTINLIPQSYRRGLTDEDRAAAYRIGGEDKHLMSIE